MTHGQIAYEAYGRSLGVPQDWLLLPREEVGPLRRLEPLGAQRQEKCGPNRPTPTGYSCNNALAWVDWFNMRRLLGPIGDIPPAEFEAQYYEQAKVA